MGAGASVGTNEDSLVRIISSSNSISKLDIATKIAKSKSESQLKHSNDGHGGSAYDLKRINSVKFLAIRQLERNLAANSNVEDDYGTSDYSFNDLEEEVGEFKNNDSLKSNNINNQQLIAEEKKIIKKKLVLNIDLDAEPYVEEDEVILKNIIKKRPDLTINVKRIDSLSSLFDNDKVDDFINNNEMKTTINNKIPNNYSTEQREQLVVPNKFVKLSEIKEDLRVSPAGTVHFNFEDKEWKIKDTGISPVAGSDNGAGKKFDFSKYKGSDFCEIANLGAGASGVVVEAVHIPTLTLVALKMLPVYNQEKRKQVASELSILYRNLAEMNLVDRKLGDDLLLDIDNDTTTTASNNNNDNISSEIDSEDKSIDTRLKTREKQTRRPSFGSSICPNVMSLFTAFSDPRSGMVNLVMEYMDGGSLEDLVQAGGCQDEFVLADIARQTLNGLNYLHSHKSIHRDIKPANILCSSSGLIKIADFGISIILDNTAIMAQSFVGTVCYMSPERIVGESYSFPSDIWSFGLTLLAVACGKFPLTDISSNDGYWGMIKAICDENPPTPSNEFSDKFSNFISICLIKDHAKRGKISELNSHEFTAIGMDEAPLSPLRSMMISPSRDQSKKGFNTNKSSRNSTPRKSFDGFDDIPTPLSARLNSVISRRGSKDNSNTESILSIKTPRKSFDGFDDIPTPLSARLNSVISRRGSKDNSNTESILNIVNVGGDDLELIDAIRIEHLERILEKIRLKGEKLKESNNFNKFTLPQLYDDEGLSSWSSLAHQLHLPVKVVELIAESRLSHLFPPKTK